MIQDTPEGSGSRRVFRNAFGVAAARRAGQECHRPLTKTHARKTHARKRKWDVYGDDAGGSWEEPSPLVRACKEGLFAQVQGWLEGCEGRELAAKLAVAHKVRKIHKSAQKLGQPQPFVAALPLERMGQLTPFGPT
jgi:hypothetical protein